MRKIGLFIAVIVAIVGCHPKEINYESGSMKLIVKGQNIDEKIQVNKFSAEETKRYKAVKNEDGSFTFEWNGDFGYYRLHLGGYESIEIYMLPNEPLMITREAEGKYNFEGFAAPQNLYHLDVEESYEKMTSNLFTRPLKNSKIVTLSDRQVIKMYSKIKDEESRLLDKYIEKYSINDHKFIKLERDYTHFKCYQAILASARIKKQELGEYMPNKKYYSLFNEIDYNNEEMFRQKTRYAAFLMSPYLGLPIGHDQINFIRFIGKRCTNAYMSSFILKANGKMFLAKNEGEEFEKVMNDINNYVTDKEVKKYLTDFYNSRMGGMPGATIPNFSYKSYDGKTYTNEDFKGKYLLIDFWATWCGPCKAQTPFFEAKAKEFEDKNVTFVAISLDDNRVRWEQYVKKNDMKNIQLISPKKEETKFAELFCNGGIPKFVLIDPDGKIVTGKFTAPSHDEFSKELNKYLD